MKTKKKYNISKSEPHIISAFNFWKVIPKTKDKLKSKDKLKLEENHKKTVDKLSKLDKKIRISLNKCPDTMNLFFKSLKSLFENYEQDEINDDSIETLAEVFYTICQHRKEYHKETYYIKALEEQTNYNNNDSDKIIIGYQGPYW